TDEDLAALQRAGTSDDALFEVTVSAALGAALGRLERGLAALRGESSPHVSLSALSSPPGPLSTSGPHPLAPSPFGRGGTQEPRRCACPPSCPVIGCPGGSSSRASAR